MSRTTRTTERSRRLARCEERLEATSNSSSGNTWSRVAMTLSQPLFSRMRHARFGVSGKRSLIECDELADRAGKARSVSRAKRIAVGDVFEARHKYCEAKQSRAPNR